MPTIKPEQLATEVGQILQTYNHTVLTEVDEAAQEVGKLAVRELKSGQYGSFIRRKGSRYDKGWAIKKERNGVVYVHNRTDYRLTHLLEKGHATVNPMRPGAKTKTRAFPHISTVENMVKEEFPAVITRRIQTQK